MSEATDQELVQAIIARGDQGSFETLYDRHTPYLYRFALRLAGGDEHAAQDVVHEAWVRACERLGTFEWRSSLRTWLASIVVNGARQLSRNAWRVTDLDQAPVAGPDPVLAATFDRVDLERAIAALPDGAREVFVLHDIEGWTHDAIADHLEIKTVTSRSQLSRARAALRARLEPGDGERRS